jgi:sortase A
MRRKLLVYFGCVLIIGGALALGWYSYLRLDMFRVQRAARRLIDQQKRNAESVHPGSLPHALVIVPRRTGEPLGKMAIPRIQLSVMVLEGTSSRILRVGAGHINGTALPGTKGNVGIAAHRDTFFHLLREVRPKDDILLTTPYGTFRYIVDSVEVVNPSDVQVLQRTTDPELTLVTCYPFTYMGAAPKRFIVHAHQQV